MALGVAASDVDLLSLEGLLGMLIAVGLPGGVGAWLLFERFRTDPSAATRRERLRAETIESEVVRLAGEKDGKLTVIEVVSALGLPPADAQVVLDSLVRRSVADIHLTDSGLIVYDFHDVRRLGEKPQSRGMLED
jgi:hypothetical protein